MNNMGYVFLTATCGNCGKMFTANPSLVPVAKTMDGQRYPICRECMETYRPEFKIPAGAYEAEECE